MLNARRTPKWRFVLTLLRGSPFGSVRTIRCTRVLKVNFGGDVVWIGERFLHVSPDGGNGLVEFQFLLLPIAALVAGLLSWRCFQPQKRRSK